MNLAQLLERKATLEASIKNIEQSFHIVTGHLAEVNYQIGQLPVDSNEVEECLVTEDVLPVE